MEITASLIKELRTITQAPMMECKKALTKTDGDIDKAIEELRKAGISKAAKRSGNETQEGKIAIKVDGGKAYVLSVACETDFVAINENFKTMMDQMMSEFVSIGNVDAAKDVIDSIKTDNALKMGENLVASLDIVEGNVIGSYVHSNGKVAAIITANDGVDEEKLKQVAMHATAMNPSFLNPADVTSDEVEKEKALQLEMMKNDPKMGEKPDEVLLKIIEGKMNKFKNEQSLTSQMFVIDPNITVSQFVGGEDKLTGFKTFKI